MSHASYQGDEGAQEKEVPYCLSASAAGLRHPDRVRRVMELLARLHAVG